MPELPTTRNADALTDDALAGHFRVWQRRRGHRYSLDDVVTAYIAARTRPQAEHVLDLGSGLGSVLLMLGYKLRGARLCAVEAQAISYDLLQRNVERNRVGERTVMRCADFRTPDLLEALARETGAAGGFALITGTPPYMPTGHGPLPPDPQRAHARVELRGGVEDYLAAAARVLHPEGRVVVCADARRPERVLQTAPRCALQVLQQTDVVPIAEHKGPLFSVFVLCRAAGHDRQPAQTRAVVAREHDGRRSPQALAWRRFFDLPADPAETASPRIRVRSQRAGA